MALVNACFFRATSTGTGDFVVASAIAGYYTPALCLAPAIIDGVSYWYRAESDDLSQYEEGEGVYTASGTTLARTTIFNSSTGSKVSFSTAPRVRIEALAKTFDRLVNAQTGTSYSFVEGDRQKLVTFSNSAAQAITLPQAGTSSKFMAGWFVCVQNISTAAAGIVTITPTTSTINGASTLKLLPGQGVIIFSDGTNYQVLLLGSWSSSGVAKANANYQGTGTPTVRSSFNLSSITRSSAGQYVLNFAASMSDTNYGVALVGDAADAPLPGTKRSGTWTTAAAAVTTFNGSVVPADTQQMSALAFEA